MSEGRKGEKPGAVDLYGPAYGQFDTDLYAEVRAEAFGADIGQTGWLTASEQDEFLSWLDLEPASRVLDVACGSGGPTLRIAQSTGCSVIGIDIREDGLAAARAQARALDLGDRADFQRHDASQTLPFDDQSFDAVVCIDALNHLPDRLAVLSDWKRVLRTGGRLLFTNPIVVTGPLSNAEIATRSSIGFFLFVPLGTDERLLKEAGLELIRSEDRTANMAENSGRWRTARLARAEALIAVEGREIFEGQQEFLRVSELLARERRLSRFVFVARRLSKSTARPD